MESSYISPGQITKRGMSTHKTGSAVSTCAVPQRLDNWSLVVAVNDDSVLHSTLLASPAIDSRCQVILKRGFKAATVAYNAGLSEAKAEIVVLAHQDVYLPADWRDNFEHALAQLALHDPHWGVLGVFGVTTPTKELSGYCYSTGLRATLGKPFDHPIPAESVDELLLVVRRSSGLRFDDNLQGFHLYGADICLQARKQGMTSYIIPAFCIHNSNGLKRLPVDFWRAYFFLHKKWRAELPIATCCTTITRWGGPALHKVVVDIRDAVLKSRKVGTRVSDVAALYRIMSRETRVGCEADPARQT